jgi:hypothetical protein
VCGWASPNGHRQALRHDDCGALRPCGGNSTAPGQLQCCALVWAAATSAARLPGLEARSPGPVRSPRQGAAGQFFRPPHPRCRHRIGRGDHRAAPFLTRDIARCPTGGRFFISGQKRVSSASSNELRQRSAIEATVGHRKTDGHLISVAAVLRAAPATPPKAVLTAFGWNFHIDSDLAVSFRSHRWRSPMLRVRPGTSSRIA